MTLIERLRRHAAERDAAHSRRSRHVQSQRSGMLAECDGKSLINFSSNDYLGFAQHPDVIAAFQQAAARDGVGSAGSALVTGHFAVHRELELQAAALFERGSLMLRGRNMADWRRTEAVLIGSEEVAQQVKQSGVDAVIIGNAA